jgi:EAL domain-containing protein (putative c-di-GMP-specific phosphodiesterase class I)
MDDPVAAADLLASLREIGVRLAIDDFGTGYSSLAYLKRFPVDVVKIDRAFIEPLNCGDTSEESLVAAIIAMTAALRLTTVAEGVETEWQARRLAHLGCTAAQGYLFSYPLAAGPLTEVLQRGTTHTGSGSGPLPVVPIVPDGTKRSNEEGSGPDTAASNSEASNSSSNIETSASASR